MGSFSSTMSGDPGIQNGGKVGGDTASSNMGTAMGTAVGSALNPERKIPQAYQGTLGLPDGTGVNGNITMSATSGQPQMGQPNLNPANTGGKGKGA
jgi:hypothetical protein